MDSPLILKELLVGPLLFRFDLWAPALVSLMTRNDSDQESIWDLANRVCDQYLNPLP